MSGTAADRLLERLTQEAEASGYHLNPDEAFTGELVDGLLVNQERYGYASCPCRLAEGDRTADLDILCPCDYRDADLHEFGCCYCALYVSPEIARGEASPVSIPERRPSRSEREAGRRTGAGRGAEIPRVLPVPVWRCAVCGYLCAMENPPRTCPICKADRDRFLRFL